MDKPSLDDQVNFIVQVKDRSETQQVATALEDQGLQVNRVLRTMGVVGGTGPSTLRDAIADVPGVGMVREEGSFQLPPFDERVPQ